MPPPILLLSRTSFLPYFLYSTYDAYNAHLAALSFLSVAIEQNLQFVGWQMVDQWQPQGQHKQTIFAQKFQQILRAGKIIDLLILENMSEFFEVGYQRFWNLYIYHKQKYFLFKHRKK